MARITVEDCLKNVKNRFDLILLASKRARQLMHGVPAKVEVDHDKSTVVALREIAAGFTDFDTPTIIEEETDILSTPDITTITETIVMHDTARPPEETE